MAIWRSSLYADAEGAMVITISQAKGQIYYFFKIYIFILLLCITAIRRIRGDFYFVGLTNIYRRFSVWNKF